jgi:hypothetical protein
MLLLNLIWKPVAVDFGIGNRLFLGALLYSYEFPCSFVANLLVLLLFLYHDDDNKSFLYVVSSLLPTHEFFSL